MSGKLARRAGILSDTMGLEFFRCARFMWGYSRKSGICGHLRFTHSITRFRPSNGGGEQNFLSSWQSFILHVSLIFLCMKRIWSFSCENPICREASKHIPEAVPDDSPKTDPTPKAISMDPAEPLIPSQDLDPTLENVTFYFFGEIIYTEVHMKVFYSSHMWCSK